MFSAAGRRGGEISMLVLLLVSLDTEQKGLGDLDLSGRRQLEGGGGQPSSRGQGYRWSTRANIC